MRGKIAIVALSLSAAALAAEPRELGGLYSKYIEDQRSVARARHDRMVEHSEAIARQAVASICTGCLGLRHQRQEPSPPIDTAELVAAPRTRHASAAEPRSVRRSQLSQRWKTLLLAGLIRD